MEDMEMSNWDLLALFYELSDGLCWVEETKFVMFKSHQSARAFRIQAGDEWSVAFSLVAETA